MHYMNHQGICIYIYIHTSAINPHESNDQEGVRGFCWEPDDTGVSRSDACHMLPWAIASKNAVIWPVK